MTKGNSKLHIDLFSGIGGFALAIDEVWDDVEHVFCEIDIYCQAILKKRFEGSEIYGDIRQFTSNTYRRSKECFILTGRFTTSDRREQHSWDKNWFEVATKLCGVDDGLPAELHGLKLSKAKHRVERLKALGNSIVPQVAIEILRGC